MVLWESFRSTSASGAKIPGAKIPPQKSPKMKKIIFHQGNILLPLASPAAPSLSPAEEEIFRFTIAGSEYTAFDLPPAAPIPAGLTPVGLRESWSLLPEADYTAATKAAELLHWNREMRHCPRCGVPLRRSGEISKKCDKCNAEYFPQIAPCVIVLVTRGEGPDEEALLVHAANFRRPFFGLVAGFVETGESLEAAVAREVKEETGLEIEDITYFGSQSWPFPHQMMIAFTARWRSGEVRFADGELTAGGFFRRDSVPPLATPPSIARRLIDAWLRLRPE